MVSSCKNDDEFWKLIQYFIGEMHYTGHLTAWGYRYMSQLEYLQNFVLEYPEYKDQLQPYLDKLDNETSRKNYSAMLEFYQEIESEVESMNAASDNQRNDRSEADLHMEETEYNNITAEIIEDGKTAYIKIDAFDMSLFNEDKETLFAFYDRVMDYENIIIDITENLGGGMDYFNQLVVAPLTTKILEVPTYQLIKGGGRQSKPALPANRRRAAGWYLAPDFRVSRVTGYQPE